MTFLSRADVDCGYYWRCYSLSVGESVGAVLMWVCTIARPFSLMFNLLVLAGAHLGSTARVSDSDMLWQKMPSTWHYHNFRWDLAILARFQNMTHADSLPGLFIESLPAEVFSPVCCRNLRWSCIISSETELALNLHFIWKKNTYSNPSSGYLIQGRTDFSQVVPWFSCLRHFKSIHSSKQTPPNQILYIIYINKDFKDWLMGHGSIDNPIKILLKRWFVNSWFQEKLTCISHN